MGKLGKITTGVLLCMTLHFNATACTLFGVSGDKVAGGGTLVAKNRDWRPTEQKIELVTPQEGYKYYALLTGKKAPYFTAGGLNEKGLFVAMSTVSSMTKEERLSYPKFKTADGRRANDYILQHFSSVDEVLQTDAKIWSEPVNFIIGDRNKVAVIEVLPGGKKSVRVQDNGVVYHTNHYVDKEMLVGNRKIGTSTATRYARIKELMTEHKGQFTIKDFWRISRDQNAGRNNSIYRLGNKPKSTRTVAEIIAYLPPTGSPQLYVRYMPKPKECYTYFRLKEGAFE